MTSGFEPSALGLKISARTSSLSQTGGAAALRRTTVGLLLSLAWDDRRSYIGNAGNLAPNLAGPGIGDCAIPVARWDGPGVTGFVRLQQPGVGLAMSAS